MTSAHPPDDRVVEVCERCLMASCPWYRFTYCSHPILGTTWLTVAELRALNREHPSYYLPHAQAPAGVLSALRDEGRHD